MDSVTSAPSANNNDSDNNNIQPMMKTVNDSEEKVLLPSKEDTSEAMRNINYETRSWIFCISIILIIPSMYTGIILAVMDFCYKNYLRSAITFTIAMATNLFTVILSRIWKYPRRAGTKLEYYVNGFVSVLLNIELCHYFKELMEIKRKTSGLGRNTYKRLLEYVDDLRWFIIVTSGLQILSHVCILLNYGLQYSFITLFLSIISIVMSLFWIVVMYFGFDFTNLLGKRRRVSYWSFVSVFGACVLYVFDVLSDIFLCLKYLCEQNYIYSVVTFLFVFISFVYLIWLNIHKKLERYLVFQYWKSITLIKQIKTKQLADESRTLSKELFTVNYGSALSNFNEAYTESASQLVLQIAILLRNITCYKELLDIFSSNTLLICSVIFSILSLTVSSTMFYRAKRIDKYKEDENLSQDDPYSWYIILLQFAVYVLLVGPRIIAISCLASIYPGYTLAAFVINWFAVLWFKLKTHPLPYALGLAVINTYTPHPTDYEFCIHIIYFLQNTFTMYLWLSNNKIGVFYPVVWIFIGLNCIGILLRMLLKYYYKLILPDGTEYSE